jgi:hypothetical protein
MRDAGGSLSAVDRGRLVELVLRPSRSEPVVAEDAPRVLDAKLPADRHAFMRGDGAPAAHLVTEPMQVRDSALAEALTTDQAGFHFCGVEPATVLRREVDLEARPQAPALAVAEGLDARALRMRAEIVDDEVDAFGLRVSLRDAVQGASEVLAGSATRCMGEPLAGLRFDDAEDVRDAVAHVLVIGSCRMTGPSGHSWSRRVAQNDGSFIEADHRPRGIVRSRVDAQHVLHLFDELGADLGHHPHFFPATA